MITRRIGLFLALSAVLLLFLVQQEVISPSRLLPRPSSSQIWRVPKKDNNETFDWADLAQHYPVSTYATLPSPAPKILPRVQYTFPKESRQHRDQRRSRRDAIEDALRRCWVAYRERAWLSDELAPVSGTSKTTFGGWAATLVDSLDTLYIMGFKAQFEEAVNAAVQIDFSTSPMDTINIFETTIRYLGGFISAYDLSGDRRLLDKCLELAEMVYHAFDTPNRMPITRWRIHEAANGARQIADENVLSAEIGSLELELTRLSQITNDPRWYDAAARVMSVFEQHQQRSNVPGMWPLVVNARTQDFSSGTVFTLGAMSDSLYEYLPKMYALLGGSTQYAQLYNRSMTAAIEHTLLRPMTPDNADILLAGPVTAESRGEATVNAEGQHLVCFAGGMLALGGRLLNIPSHVEYGRKLTDGCIWTYEHSELGIMPETFTMLQCQNKDSCPWDQAKWEAEVTQRAGADASAHPQDIIASQRIPKGFTSMPDRRYILRPEAIESVFYLYRITGDPTLQEAAWRMFENIYNHTETGIANAALIDVSDPTAPKSDSMESFWTAETLKYFYLIFSEPEKMSLDDWVFSTEAHPFKRPKPSSGTIWRR